MTTLILPGGSIGNKKWADELDIADKTVWNWEHWKTGIDVNIDVNQEAKKIYEKYKGQKINILAKSIGSLVLMKLFKLGLTPNKYILCGVPLKVIKEMKAESDYQVVSEYVPEIIVQNTQDPLGSFTKISEFIHNINPNITLISKEADNHSYPYPDEFNKYLV